CAHFNQARTLILVNCRISPVAVFGNPYASSLDAHLGDPRRFAGSTRRDINIHGPELAPVTRSVKQPLVIVQLAILRGPYDQLCARWSAGKQRVDVTFSVTNNDQLRDAIEKIA